MMAFFFLLEREDHCIEASRKLPDGMLSLDFLIQGNASEIESRNE